MLLSRPSRAMAHPLDRLPRKSTVEFIEDALKRHLGARTFGVLGRAYQPLVLGWKVVLVMWLMLAWMYRRKVFLRI